MVLPNHSTRLLLGSSVLRLTIGQTYPSSHFFREPSPGCSGDNQENIRCCRTLPSARTLTTSSAPSAGSRDALQFLKTFGNGLNLFRADASRERKCGLTICGGTMARKVENKTAEPSAAKLPEVSRMIGHAAIQYSAWLVAPRA
jgi:hypothetical protein